MINLYFFCGISFLFVFIKTKNPDFNCIQRTIASVSEKQKGGPFLPNLHSFFLINLSHMAPSNFEEHLSWEEKVQVAEWSK